MAKITPFEKYTEQYEEWFEKNRWVYEAELRAIKAVLPTKGLGIETGVGTGRFAGPLGIKIGIEPSERRIFCCNTWQERRRIKLQNLIHHLIFLLENFLNKELFMPIYEYECETCHHYFERLTFKGDDEHINCPKCGANKVKKLLSAGSFMSKTGIGVCSAGSPKGFS